MTATDDRRLIAAGVTIMLTLAASGACTTTHGHHTHGREPNTHVAVCGTVLADGAAVPGVRTLSPPGPHVPSAPARSRLPARYRGAPPGRGMLRIVRVASGCADGATVLVRPLGHVRLVRTVPGSNGGLIAVVLVRLTDAPATIYAYRDGEPIGQLTT